MSQYNAQPNLSDGLQALVSRVAKLEQAVAPMIPTTTVNGSTIVVGSMRIAWGTAVFAGTVGPPVSFGVTFKAAPLVIISNGDGDANGTWVGVGSSLGHATTTTTFYPESASTAAARINWIAIGPA